MKIFQTGILMLTLLTHGVSMSDSIPDPRKPSSLMNDWQLISDQVMGGRSSGTLNTEAIENIDCLHLTGQVTTENNGGFLQMAHELTTNEREQALQAVGFKMRVRGNNETYNIHLRTFDLWLPWQSYRASFNANEQWQLVTVPFSSFLPYKTSKPLNVEKIKRLGIVGIGRDFNADICVAELTFY